MKKSPKKSILSGKIQLLAIVGPTSSGKSDLAVALAKKFNGEIISADSRQIYKGMDIGTGKITKKEIRGVPHHLLSFVSPKRKDFSVSNFKNLADKKIHEIAGHGKLPILVGGTGFWVDAVAFNQTFPQVPPNPGLRKKLEKLSTEKMFELLKELDPARAKNIDSKNPRRLIRAIEIAKFKDKNKAGALQTAPTASNYQTLFIGLDMPNEILTKKIKLRLLKRLKQGLITEVQKLHQAGISWGRLDDFGLEYRYVSNFLQKKINKAQLIQQLSFAIKHYAKRQRTWFKRNKQIHWFNSSNKKTALQQSLRLLNKFTE